MDDFHGSTIVGIFGIDSQHHSTESAAANIFLVDVAGTVMRSHVHIAGARFGWLILQRFIVVFSPIFWRRRGFCACGSHGRANYTLISEYQWLGCQRPFQEQALTHQTRWFVLRDRSKVLCFSTQWVHIALLVHGRQRGWAG